MINVVCWLTHQEPSFTLTILSSLPILPVKQHMSFDEVESKNANSDLGEDFYGDSEYDEDELDKDGFEGLSDGPLDNPYDDDRY